MVETVDDVGQCEADCTNLIYNVTRQQAAGGDRCLYKTGDKQECQPGMAACPAEFAPVDCVGAWGTCDANCDRTYAISVVARAGGIACPYAHGVNAKCPAGTDACPVWPLDVSEPRTRPAPAPSLHCPPALLHLQPRLVAPPAPLLLVHLVHRSGQRLTHTNAPPRLWLRWIASANGSQPPAKQTAGPRCTSTRSPRLAAAPIASGSQASRVFAFRVSANARPTRMLCTARGGGSRRSAATACSGWHPIGDSHSRKRP